MKTKRITMLIKYGEDYKFKTAKELMIFFEDNWSAASHDDLFAERDRLVERVRELEDRLEGLEEEINEEEINDR